MNGMKALQTFIDAAEKLATLPVGEVTNNPRLVDEIKNALSAHNVDAILNEVRNSLAEQRETARAKPRLSDEKLLSYYARREHERLSNVAAKIYATEPVSYADFKALAENKLPDKASGAAEENFATAYNSVYADGAVKINVAGDPSLLSSYIDYTPYRVNLASYFSIPTLAPMVDKPIELAFKKPAIIETKNEKFQKAIEGFLERVQAESVMRDAVFFSSLSARGALIVPVLQDGRIKLNAFNDTQFSFGLSHGYATITADYSATRVGQIYCLGASLVHGSTCFFLCPGFDPLYGVGKNRVPQIKDAATAWNLYVGVLKTLLVRSQVLIEKMEGDMQTDTMLTRMRAQLQRLSQTMGVSTPIEQPRGATLDILNNNISPGTADIASVFKEFVGILTGVAPEYFFGGGNSNYSQAAFQIASTNETVRARYQIAQIKPMLKFIIDTAVRHDDELKQFAGERYKIDFENIYDETEAEKADLKSKKTETLIRQRSYSELADEFKRQKLLDGEANLDFEPDHDGDDNAGQGDAAGGSRLENPLT